MKVGFTGTQQGCTLKQNTALRMLLNSMHVTEFHHGNCIGADAEAHWMMAGRAEVHVHPSNIPEKQAECVGYKTYPPKPPLTRNRDIVNATDTVIACPKGEDEELRSGTWATVRYARSKDKRIILVLPNGSVKNDTGTA